MQGLGKLVTNCFSKFGLCSRKAAIRLATETGQVLVDKSAKLGRDLTTSEVESIFKQTLPKRLRPKIITSAEQGAREWSNRTKMTIQESEGLIDNAAGCVFMAGRKKSPMLINPKEIPFFNPSTVDKCALYAHELEHALEYNCRPLWIIKRKFLEPLKLLTKDKAKYHRDINNLGLNFQLSLPQNNSNNYEQIIKELTHGNKTKIKTLKQFMDIEIPAYTTGNNVEKYANSLGLTTEGVIIDKATRKTKMGLIPLEFEEKQGNAVTIYKNALDVLKEL